jgi:PhnB protein
MKLANYLFFTSQCQQAMSFYTACGLGKVVEIKYLEESSTPVPNRTLSAKVMHAKFEGPGVLFFASDNEDAEPMRGSAHFLTLENREQTKLLFGKLAEGGKVTTALGIQPWGDYFGKLTDQFGVQWMLISSE